MSKQNGESSGKDKHSTNHFVVHKKKGSSRGRLEPFFTILAIIAIYALVIFVASILLDLILLFADLLL